MAGPDAVGETLARATDPALSFAAVTPHLAALITAPPTPALADATLFHHPLAVWVELSLGLDDRQQLRRRPPVPWIEAVARLAPASGIPAEACDPVLMRFLTRVSLPETTRGGSGDAAFLPFKLHRFIAGAGELFVPLTAPPRRPHFEGQREDSDNPGHRLYPPASAVTAGRRCM
jgi:hypothetical protein